MSSITTSINRSNFRSNAVFEYLNVALESLKEDDKSKLLNQIAGIFEFVIKNKQGKIQIYTLDLKKEGLVIKGPLNESSANVILYICDGDFVDLVNGRLNGQRAFMLGKLKIQGRMDLAIRLDSIFKQLVGKSKL